MGSAFYTFTEAANRLNRHKRSLHNYIKKGLLRREIINGEVVLNREDVDQLAIDSGVDVPSMNRKSFIELQQRVRKLEEQMKTVTHILEIRDDQLRPNEKQASDFFRAANDSLGRKGSWSFDEVEWWSKYLERMDEGFIQAVCKVELNNQAWAPFFRLCMDMSEYSLAQFQKSPDIKWQAVYQKLDVSKKKLRAAVVVWVELNRGQTSAVLDALDDPKSTLFRRLAPGMSKNTP